MSSAQQPTVMPFRLRIPLSGSFRFTHEPLETVAGDRFVGRETQLSRLADRILFSNGGAFLITGYRGVGKTSFVNQLIARIERATLADNPNRISRVIGIHLNLARPLTPVDLMFLVTRSLYLRLRELGIDRELDPRVVQDLKRIGSPPWTHFELLQLPSL